MEFGSNAKLQAQIGRVCLVFARVEQEAGYVVQASDGNWDLAGSRDYLDYSSASGALLDLLKEVGRDYPDVQGDVQWLCQRLRALKSNRDEWAHSAAVIDTFLLMRERGVTSMRFPDPEVPEKLLNSKKAGHSDLPTDTDVDAFCAEASDVGDAARALAMKIAQLVTDVGVRTVRSASQMPVPQSPAPDPAASSAAPSRQQGTETDTSSAGPA